MAPPVGVTRNIFGGSEIRIRYLRYYLLCNFVASLNNSKKISILYISIPALRAHCNTLSILKVNTNLYYNDFASCYIMANGTLSNTYTYTGKFELSIFI